MPAFNPETGEVIAPAGTASIAFFHADRPDWTANAYRTAECEGTRQGSHGSVIAALPDGSFPPVFLWDEINYRVIAKAADGSTVATIERVTADAEFVGTAAPEPAVEPEPQPEPEPVIDLAAENEALRARVAELEARDTSVFVEAPLLPAPDALMSDYGPVGMDDITGDLLLDAFEENEAETAAVIQVLSATRQRHLSEQLNVEKARLRREHMLTDQANPREASIDRLLGLLTRRGD
jgi:hypothetical protein